MGKDVLTPKGDEGEVGVDISAIFPVLQKSRLGMKQYEFPVWFGSTSVLASQSMWS